MNEDFQRLMERENQRSQILLAVYRAYDKSYTLGLEHFHVEVNEIKKDFSVSRMSQNCILKAINYLTEEEFLSCFATNSNLGGSLYSLTHKGLLKAEEIIHAKVPFKGVVGVMPEDMEKICESLLQVEPRVQNA